MSDSMNASLKATIISRASRGMQGHLQNGFCTVCQKIRGLTDSH